MKFTIDRAKWARGEQSLLLRSTDDKMCCLGFFLESCGSPRERLLEVGEPNEVAADLWTDWRAADQNLKWPEAALFLARFDEDDEATEDDDQSTWRGTDAETAIILTNDNPDLSESTRERDIAAFFANHGHEVDFVGPTQSEGAADE